MSQKKIDVNLSTSLPWDFSRFICSDDWGGKKPLGLSHFCVYSTFFSSNFFSFLIQNTFWRKSLSKRGWESKLQNIHVPCEKYKIFHKIKHSIFSQILRNKLINKRKVSKEGNAITEPPPFPFPSRNLETFWQKLFNFTVYLLSYYDTVPPKWISL